MSQLAELFEGIERGCFGCWRAGIRFGLTFKAVAQQDKATDVEGQSKVQGPETHLRFEDTMIPVNASVCNIVVHVSSDELANEASDDR